MKKKCINQEKMLTCVLALPVKSKFTQTSSQSYANVHTLLNPKAERERVKMAAVGWAKPWECTHL